MVGGGDNSQFDGTTEASGTVDADDGIVSADTDAYFNSLDGNQGDVTQERNDPEPTALPRWVSDILNAFGPGLCSGDGIPCYLKQKGPLDLTVGNLTGGGYGVHAQYVYTVEDIFGNPTPVDSVTEWLTVLAATSNAPTPNPSTWTGDNLPLGLYFNDYLDLIGPSANFNATSVVFQTFTASMGGNTYSLLNQNTIEVAYGPGGPTGSIGVAHSNQNSP